MEIKYNEYSKEITIITFNNIFKIRKEHIKGTLIENYYLYELIENNNECNEYYYITEKTNIEDILLYIQKNYL